jgi:hypothetical protein
MSFFDAVSTLEASNLHEKLGFTQKFRSYGIAWLALHQLSTLQRQNTEILKQIFPEQEYGGLNPNFNIHASLSDLYIPTTGLPILLEEICRPILGIYKSLTDT